MDKKFSLKDYLFNEDKIQNLAIRIQKVYASFPQADFVKTTVKEFPALELKARINWISENLHRYLPTDYKEALQILLVSLPPENDPKKTDNDFGDFIYAPYAAYVAKYGCNEGHLSFSLHALKEITKRFSAEDAIRYFINAYPEETIKTILTWTKDEHYHVRRLASEGTRPKLPWAQKVSLEPKTAIHILDRLYYDKTRYVTRSVANHMNDISKIDPELAIVTLDRWKQSEKQNPHEMTYIINHALRSLIKKGDKKAIIFLNLSTEPAVVLSNFEVTSPISFGDYLAFSFDVTAEKDEELILDYVLHFPNKNGTANNKKVFKIRRIAMLKNQTISIYKRHRMLQVMTTRTLYPGRYSIEIQINGNKVADRGFDLM